MGMWAVAGRRAGTLAPLTLLAQASPAAGPGPLDHLGSPSLGLFSAVSGGDALNLDEESARANQELENVPVQFLPTPRHLTPAQVTLPRSRYDGSFS
eukprot:gene19903-26606_t